MEFETLVERVIIKDNVPLDQQGRVLKKYLNKLDRVKGSSTFVEVYDATVVLSSPPKRCPSVLQLARVINYKLEQNKKLMALSYFSSQDTVLIIAMAFRSPRGFQEFTKKVELFGGSVPKESTMGGGSRTSCALSTNRWWTTQYIDTEELRRCPRNPDNKASGHDKVRKRRSGTPSRVRRLDSSSSVSRSSSRRHSRKALYFAQIEKPKDKTTAEVVPSVFSSPSASLRHSASRRKSPHMHVIDSSNSERNSRATQLRRSDTMGRYSYLQLHHRISPCPRIGCAVSKTESRRPHRPRGAASGTASHNVCPCQNSGRQCSPCPGQRDIEFRHSHEGRKCPAESEIILCRQDKPYGSSSRVHVSGPSTRSVVYNNTASECQKQRLLPPKEYSNKKLQIRPKNCSSRASPVILSNSSTDSSFDAVVFCTLDGQLN